MSLPREINKNEAPGPSSRQHGGTGALARLYWMLGGNAIVGYMAVAIGRHSHALSWRDLLYWAAAGSLVVVRYLDVTLLDGTTADGERATGSDWRRYSTVALLICACVWVAAHVVALIMGR